MEFLNTIATLLPLSLTSGINLYATVLVVGLTLRLGWVQNAPAGLDVLATWPVLVTAGILYLIGFLADKIPFVDNLWDVAHTFIRPIGAAMLALAVIGDARPELLVVGALIGGGVALASHSSKAGARAAVNVASPAENISNIGLSLAEDASVGVLAFLSVKYPYLAGGIAVIALGLIVLLAPRIIGWGWFTLRALFARLKGFVQKVRQSDALPVAHLIVLGHQAPELAGRCRAQGVPRAGGRAGYLSVRGGRLSFTYDHWFQSRVWTLAAEQIAAVYLRRRLLLDVVEVHYRDGRGRARRARFAFMKDRGPLAEQFAALGKPAGAS